MGDLLTAASLTVPLATGSLLGVRVALAERAAGHLKTFRLTFPRSVEAGQVVAALRSVQGLLPRFPDRLVVTRSLVVEVVATDAGITHYLSVSEGTAALVLGQLQAALPGLRAVPAEPPDRRADLARELHAVGEGALRMETTLESNAALLAPLQPLGSTEAAFVQWIIAPVEPAPRWLFWLRRLRADAGDRDAASAEPELYAVCRIGVRGPQPQTLIARVFGAIHRADTTDRRLARRLLPSVWVATSVQRAAIPVFARRTLGTDELAAVIGVPVGGPQLPGLRYAESRTLPPVPEISRRGRVLGDAVATAEPVALTEGQSLTGLMVTSPTGSGKSTVLERLCAADFAAGRSVVVIESKGDLIPRLANLVPAAHITETIVFDPADPKPAGFNVLAGGDADLTVDHLVGQFTELFSGYVGPRSQMLLRGALLTLAEVPGDWTLCEAMAVLTNSGLRRRLMAGIANQQLAELWTWFESQSEAAQAEMAGPLMNKLAAFVLRRNLRAVVGQTKSALDFDLILRTPRIVLISLAQGLVGKDAANLLGSCILGALWAAIQRRAALPQAERPFVSVVLDEAQDFLWLPGIAPGDAAAKSRGLGVGWTVSFQALSQIKPELRASLLANLRSKLIMQTTAEDARRFAREFAPHLAASDLQGLPDFHAYAVLSTGASVTPPVSVRTRPPLPPLGSGETVRKCSRERYGRTPSEVDAEIRERLDSAAPEAPVGARRRR